jgi:hypothetical protein
MATNPDAFVGDYFYQESRKEQVNSMDLTDRVTWILELLKENRGSKNSTPKNIFILRDGLSEGQALMVYL